MASVRLQPPSAFDFKDPDAWQRWKRRFEQFRLASGLSEDDGAKQVSTLLYCMGEDAEDRLSSTDITADGRKEYATVVKKFDDFFKVRKNVIFERARFNRRCQNPDESAEQVHNKPLQSRRKLRVCRPEGPNDQRSHRRWYSGHCTV